MRGHLLSAALSPTTLERTSVMMLPGPMAFTRMPYGASARAMHLHNLNIYMLEKHPP